MRNDKGSMERADKKRKNEKQGGLKQVQKRKETTSKFLNCKKLECYAVINKHA
jgi:hypothetical protein